MAQSLAMETHVVIIEQIVAQMSENSVYYDVLTGLPSRLLLSQSLNLALAQMRDGEVLAAIFLGLDRFKI
ncbi:diguanylate cyclase domain-containing protein, partial [Chamaesiphon sp. OTE_8_metabat_110]|uniref:diguanylate cyclase domain-containing protein n=2 Tax=Chamaesiphon sp. OTE_8_metabat_110 TaxID=2964696 RepID=UPI00286C2759